MKLAALSLLIFASSGTGAIAQGQTQDAAIRYHFQTLLVPDPIVRRSVTVKTHDAWFTGKAVPARVVLLDADVNLAGTPFALKQGTPMGVPLSSHFIACQRDAPMSINAGMGHMRVCLIDMDADGLLDAWFRRGGGVVWDSYNSKISRDDITPMTPVRSTAATPEQIAQLEPWGYFHTAYQQGMLTYCMGASDSCLQEAPKIKPSAEEQTVEFMGGMFSYRKAEGGGLAFQILRDPTGAIY